MGNRAYVIFANRDFTRFSPAVYLHWNGGSESVYAFLAELNYREVRADQEYECARFCQVVGEFFDSDGHYSGLSLGVVSVPDEVTVQKLAQIFQPGDNGLYLVCREVEGMKMRRFDRYDGVEASEEDVKNERLVAENDEYYRAITKKFRDMANGKLPEVVYSRIFKEEEV